MVRDCGTDNANRGPTTMGSYEERSAIGVGSAPAPGRGRLGKVPSGSADEGGEASRWTGAGKPALLRRDGTGQNEILEPFPQHGLENFAGGCVRNLVDENDLIGHPPARDLALHEPQDLVPGRCLILLENDDEERPFVPFGMLYADDGCFRHLGVTDGEVLEVDR